jgi:hydrogenase nickel incorporation protein HypB
LLCTRAAPEQAEISTFPPSCVTEGIDKPLEYPVMFRKADLVVISKVDLLPHLPDVSVSALAENLARVMPSAELIALSATTGAGVAELVTWLLRHRPAARAVRGVRNERVARPALNPDPPRTAARRGGTSPRRAERGRSPCLA